MFSYTCHLNYNLDIILKLLPSDKLFENRKQLTGKSVRQKARLICFVLRCNDEFMQHICFRAFVFVQSAAGL